MSSAVVGGPELYTLAPDFLSVSRRVKMGGNKNGETEYQNDYAILPRRKAGQAAPHPDRAPVLLTKAVLSNYFGMPLSAAAKELGICATAIKKVCRKLGILKWPFRDRHMQSRGDISNQYSSKRTESKLGGKLCGQSSSHRWSDFLSASACTDQSVISNAGVNSEISIDDGDSAVFGKQSVSAGSEGFRDFVDVIGDDLRVHEVEISSSTDCAEDSDMLDSPHSSPLPSSDADLLSSLETTILMEGGELSFNKKLTNDGSCDDKADLKMETAIASNDGSEFLVGLDCAKDDLANLPIFPHEEVDSALSHEDDPSANPEAALHAVHPSAFAPYKDRACHFEGLAPTANPEAAAPQLVPWRAGDGRAVEDFARHASVLSCISSPEELAAAVLRIPTSSTTLRLMRESRRAAKSSHKSSHAHAQ